MISIIQLVCIVLLPVPVPCVFSPFPMPPPNVQIFEHVGLVWVTLQRQMCPLFACMLVFCVCEMYLLCVLVSITIGMALSYLFPSIGLSVVTVASRDREQVDGAVCFLGPGK